MNEPITETLREGLSQKYPFMNYPLFPYLLLGVVVIVLIIGFWILIKRKNKVLKNNEKKRTRGRLTTKRGANERAKRGARGEFLRVRTL